MTNFDPNELPAELDAGERAVLSETAALLVAACPRPGAGFRGALRRQTLDEAGILVARPPRLRRRILAFVAAGALLVLAAASGLTGTGPLTPPSQAARHIAQAR